jgi:hypothetical protein
MTVSLAPRVRPSSSRLLPAGLVGQMRILKFTLDLPHTPQLTHLTSLTITMCAYYTYSPLYLVPGEGSSPIKTFISQRKHNS